MFDCNGTGYPGLWSKFSLNYPENQVENGYYPFSVPVLERMTFGHALGREEGRTKRSRTKLVIDNYLPKDFPHNERDSGRGGGKKKSVWFEKEKEGTPQLAQKAFGRIQEFPNQLFPVFPLSIAEHSSWRGCAREAPDGKSGNSSRHNSICLGDT